MSDTDIFGPLIQPQIIADEIADFHYKWIDTYLAAYERDAGKTPPYFSREIHYAKKSRLATIPGEDQMPLIVVVNQGATDIAMVSRRVDVTFNIGIATVTSSHEETGARFGAGAYAIATFAMLMHRRNLDSRLGGRMRVVKPREFRLDDLPEEEVRSKAICRMQFDVEVRDVVRLNAGPNTPEPPTNPYPDPGGWPTVDEVVVNVTREYQT